MLSLTDDNIDLLTIDERTTMNSEKRVAAEVGERTRFMNCVKGATVLIEIPTHRHPGIRT